MSRNQKKVAVLYARSDSIYKRLPKCDVWDAERDARNFTGGMPVVAHPPCRSWGRLRWAAKPAPGEKELGLLAVEQVRMNGGVLEHPAKSTLWKAAGLPLPSLGYDIFGGWTLRVFQYWWGHPCAKDTWLYIVGIEYPDLPHIPVILGEPTHVISPSNGIKRGHPRWKPEVGKTNRERTPVRLARWLVDLAQLTKKPERELCA